ncbi:MAG: Lrp/AsnC ligand binding domain-containing protein [Bacteroidales bacterium]
MGSRLQLDSLDRRILSVLMQDARTPYLEIARRCSVSGAAIHQRINRMTAAGLIKGSSLNLDMHLLGWMTCAFVGIQINLTASTTHQEVFDQISRVPEIVECHHITGKYSLLAKIYAENNEHLKQILVEKIQSIPEVVATETLISLEEGFTRPVRTELP